MNIIDSNINSFLIKQQQQNGIKEITGSDGKRENKIKKEKCLESLFKDLWKKLYIYYILLLLFATRGNWTSDTISYRNVFCWSKSFERLGSMNKKKYIERFIIEQIQQQ